jgi:hypothetical protein
VKSDRKITIEASSIQRLRLTGLALAWALVVVSFSLGGCTTKSKAQSDARTAFLAGQQESMMRMQQGQNQVPTVSVQGRVRNNIVPWTEDLTIAKAIVAAEYYGHTDPTQIILVRQRVAKRIDPRTLLSGEDVPLLPGDIIELR